ncbi:hypothetical protein EV648_10851 [Kribbella sp. VKM Ac-2568]|nr:hypothetical protein EV648_10851 [Kribbella sp. VKM Ac-2568]
MAPPGSPGVAGSQVMPLSREVPSDRQYAAISPSAS